MTSQTLLMYHAVYDSDPLNLDGADPHYAVDQESFVKQLTRLHGSNHLMLSLERFLSADRQDQQATIITFDDGHISNYTIAYPRLEIFSATADFFINSAMVGKKGFIPWPKLREMAEHGQSIQSHGHEHHYFDEMDKTETKRQLETSKKMIEDHVGKPVTLFAPPGGRLANHTWDIAQTLGYRAIASSIPGVWQNRHDVSAIPRFAMLNATSMNQFEKWVTADRSEVFKQTARYMTTYYAKKILGNKNYEKVREKLLALK